MPIRLNRRDQNDETMASGHGVIGHRGGSEPRGRKSTDGRLAAQSSEWPAEWLQPDANESCDEPKLIWLCINSGRREPPGARKRHGRAINEMGKHHVEQFFHWRHIDL